MADNDQIWSSDNPDEINIDAIPEQYRELMPGILEVVAQKAGVKINQGRKPKDPIKRAKRSAVGDDLDPAQIEFTPRQLISVLATIVETGSNLSTMIWGPPGIGKSSIVREVAQAFGLEVRDVRLSQLGPTDLRGLPAARSANDGAEIMRFLPPDFLPRSGKGIIFLDEINLAPPVMMGMAQQLLLDRRVGDYMVPEGWFVWAAGNRREDKAAVSAMPSPVANRMVHLDLIPDGEDWALYAAAHGVRPEIIGYVMSTFKRGAGSREARDWSPLLVVPTDGSTRFPSPRSWAMASKMLDAGLPVALAVGSAEALSLKVFTNRFSTLVKEMKEGAKSVDISFGDGIVVAWMAETLGFKGKINVKGNQKEFDAMRQQVRSLLEA